MIPRLLAAASLLLALCPAHAARPTKAQMAVVVSVKDQKMVLLKNGQRVAQYPVSTSKFGVGDRSRSYSTPLGTMVIAQKIGTNAPKGAVFKGRRMTGEVLRPNAPGRDPIVTRIMRLRGLEAQNRGAYSRAIYIHGTPEERLIGRPASYGCVRMRSQDVMRLYNIVPVGTKVEIVNASISQALHDVAGGVHE